MVSPPKVRGLSKKKAGVGIEMGPSRGKGRGFSSMVVKGGPGMPVLPQVWGSPVLLGTGFWALESALQEDDIDSSLYLSALKA